MSVLRLDDHFVAPEAGCDLPAPFCPLPDLPLVILVGVTGVGKSSALARLAAQNLPLTLLPDRRLITDRVIIARLQRQDGLAPHPVKDRQARFQYTARYRAAFPGGMAHALRQLWVDPRDLVHPLIFDGLRGLDEVRYAVASLPQSRFVVLEAPDFVRASRLLNRADPFDAFDLSPAGAADDVAGAFQAIPGFESVFDAEQQQRLARLAGDGAVSAAELVKKVSIIVEERRNYDPAAAKTYLQQTLPPDRCLVINTAAAGVETVVAQIMAWL